MSVSRGRETSDLGDVAVEGRGTSDGTDVRGGSMQEV